MKFKKLNTSSTDIVALDIINIIIITNTTI